MCFSSDWNYYCSNFPSRENTPNNEYIHSDDRSTDLHQYEVCSVRSTPSDLASSYEMDLTIQVFLRHQISRVSPSPKNSCGLAYQYVIKMSLQSAELVQGLVVCSLHLSSVDARLANLAELRYVSEETASKPGDDTTISNAGHSPNSESNRGNH